MNGFAQSLRHLAFFQTLATSEEGTPGWTAASAGLVVLRLVDAWLDEGTSVAAADSWSLRAARESVLAMSAGDPARGILAGVLDTLEQQQRVNPTKVFPRLMAYGQSLDYEGAWALAADVFRTVVAHVHPLEDPDLAIDANMQLAYSARMLGDLDEAEMAGAQAEETAVAVGDMVKTLRARMVAAKIAQARGNLPQAESLLDATIAEAEEARLGEVHGLALHDRATIAHLRGEYERGIRLGYEALQQLTNPSARDRVLADMAAAFLELGARSIAREALLVLAATAQEQYVRWLATLNLLDIAARDQREPAFEQYRRELVDAPLPPALRAHYHYELGVGYQRFMHFEQAQASLERAQAMANDQRLYQLAFQAEQALADVQRQILPVHTRAVEPALAIRDVAEAISEMRRNAGVPA